MPVIQAESSQRGVLYRLSLPGNPAHGGRDRAMLLTAFMLTLAAPSTAVVGFEGPKYCAQALNQQAQSSIGIKTSQSSAGVVASASFSTVGGTARVGAHGLVLARPSSSLGWALPTLPAKLTDNCVVISRDNLSRKPSSRAGRRRQATDVQRHAPVGAAQLLFRRSLVQCVPGSARIKILCWQTLQGTPSIQGNERPGVCAATKTLGGAIFAQCSRSLKRQSHD